MKKIGILGGFGPSTTAEFFLSLISAWNKRNKVHRPEIIIWNAPVNNRSERAFIKDGLNSSHFLPLLKSGVKILENSGVELVVLPCNSLHIFIDQIRESTNLPVLSIIEETTKKLSSMKIKRVVLLGNETTVRSRLFNKNFAHASIQIVLPSKRDQVILNQIIHNLVGSSLV